MRGTTTELAHGWGRTSPTRSEVARPQDHDEVRRLLAAGPGPDGRGLLVRGRGRSYGDTAQNGGGLLLDLSARARIRGVDADAATVDVDAGVSLDALLRAVLPLGLTLPVQPGTRQVSVGGAIACDIHGKNHHVAGSFARHVAWLDLMTPDGCLQRLAPQGPDPDLFWATTGGLGLTGVVLRAGLLLRRVETSSVVVRSERQPDLPSVMASLEQHDATSEHTVAWFDSVATGRGAGRGIVLAGRDATVDDLPVGSRTRPLAVPGDRELTVPPSPLSLVNRASGRVFNEAWFRKVPRRPATRVEPAFGFFQPLDGLAHWNRLYGPRGLVQYQLAVPHEAAATVVEVVETLARSGHVSCLNVLKRFGPGAPGPLSFPAPGWTLAVDVPVRPGLARLLDRLDELVLAVGGRVYLAKDARLPARHLATMYPRLADFEAVRRRVDPDGVLASDLGRRLGLVRPPTPGEAP